MRHAPAVLALLLVACGGGSTAQRAAKAPSAEEQDTGFSEYAATHGITALNGGGGETTEVSADGLRLERLDKDKAIKFDGVIGEWPALAKASVVAKGASTKTTMSVGLAYDDAKLYLAADIVDPAFVAGRDHVSLLLAIPEPGGGYTSYDLGFYAGKPGESEGSVRAGRRGAIGGAKIVEAPNGSGYTMEAAIPWSALPAARSTRVGVHGVARYVASDVTLATGEGDPQHPRSMPWIPSEPELSLIEQLLAPKGLTKTAPVAELVADLTGDGVRERVAVFEHYLTICGTSYLGGTGFFFRDLVGEVLSLEVRDVTGRGKGDVVLRRRASSGDGTREYLEVLSVLDPAHEPRVAFAHEIEIRQSDRHVDNAVRLGHGQIELSVEPATGWDPASYSEPVATDVGPLLLPWGPVRVQTWRWDGARFAKAKEVLQKEQLPPGAAPTRTAEADDAPPRPPEPPTPTVARGGDLSAQVLEAYRRERSIAASAKPKVDLRVQVAGDEQPERVLLFGRDIVVFGPGFKSGTGYAYTTLTQFAEPADVKDLSARDLTGDGNADLVVRGVRRLSAAGHGTVESEATFVYQVDDSGTISRIFGIETGREQSAKRIQGLVQFIPSPNGKSFDVLSAPGRAVGWNARSYPWSQEQPGSGGDVEPLLLPWGGIKSARYTWNGTGFVVAKDE